MKWIYLLLLCILIPSFTSARWIGLNDTYNGIGNLAGMNWSTVLDRMLQDNYVGNPFSRIYYQEISNGSVTLMWVPWYSTGNDFTETDLRDTYTQSAYGVNANYSINTAVTDELSEWWMGAVNYLTWTQVQEFINYMDACSDSTSGHDTDLTSWICSRNGSTVTKNDKNSASDASARIALGFFMGALDTDFTTTQRSIALSKAINISAAMVEQEFVTFSTCPASPVNTSTTLCHFRLAGAAQAWGSGAVTQVGQQMFYGYHESDIMALLAACAASGNTTFCDYAEDEAHQFLWAMGFTNSGNASSDFRNKQHDAHYYFNSSSTPYGVASQGTSNQWDNADGPRAWETCNNVAYFELTYNDLGRTLPWEYHSLKKFCEAWSTRILNSGSVSAGVSLQLASSTAACYRLAFNNSNSSGYCGQGGVVGSNTCRPIGWVANMVAYKTDPAYFNTFINGTLRYYDTTNQYYSSSASCSGSSPTTRGFGIYSEVRIPRAIRYATGWYEFMFTNDTLGTTQSDTTSPTISSLACAPTNQTLTITYTTNEAANESLKYGTTTALTGGTVTNTSFGTSHRVVFSSLSANTLYYYNVTGNDSSGNGFTNGTNSCTTEPNPDITPPIISSVSCVDTGTTSGQCTWTTNEGSNSSVNYGITTALGTWTGINTENVTSHTVSITSLSVATQYFANVSSCDSYANCNNASGGNFTTDGDVTPPVISNGAPSGAQAPGTLAVSLAVTTDESATCKYDSVDTTYVLMANTFSSTGATSHGQTITGMTDGAVFTKYIRCSDTLGNKNSDSYVVSWSIATCQPFFRDTPQVCDAIRCYYTYNQSCVANDTAYNSWTYCGPYNRPALTMTQDALNGTYNLTFAATPNAIYNASAGSYMFDGNTTGARGLLTPNINTSSTIFFNESTNFSLAGEFYTVWGCPSNGANSSALISRQVRMGISFNNGSGCRASWGLRNSSDNLARTVTSANTGVSQNNIYVFVMTHDASTRNTSLYRNGTLIDSFIATIILGSDVTNPRFHIGDPTGIISGNSQRFNGDIRHAWIYNRVLTNAELLSFGENNYSTTGLVANWPFNNQTASSACNVAG